MIIIKKNNSYITLLLLVITFNACAMDQPGPEETSWVDLAGKAILDGIASFRQFLSEIHSQATQVKEPINPFPFTELPLDIQNTIIGLLTQNSTTQALEEAAYTINSLARTTPELNKLINGRDFCLQIIKNLAKKFNCSDFKVCAALRTKQAKYQLNLQRQLFQMCQITNPSKDIFTELCLNGVDLEFTYNNNNEEVTPLMLASLCNSDMTIYLLDAEAQINNTNKNGTTALMLSINSGLAPWAIEQLIANPSLTINQQDKDGNTALLLCIQQKNKLDAIIYRIELLLKAGADPELANNANLTPLAAAQQTGNREIINLIENAISKKYEKK